MIRRATEADVGLVLEMGARFYASSSYANWAPFCAESAAATVVGVIKSGVLLIAESDGRPAGMVGVFIAPFMFNASLKAAYEVFWWVEPHARGGITAWRLLKSVEEACRQEGCASIQMLTLAESPAQAIALYERAGYTHTEKSFTKILGNK